MKQVGVYEAKTKLARLLDEVEQGETITITRHGRPIARLVPVCGRRRTVHEAIDTIRELGTLPNVAHSSPLRHLDRPPTPPGQYAA